MHVPSISPVLYLVPYPYFFIFILLYTYVEQIISVCFQCMYFLFFEINGKSIKELNKESPEGTPFGWLSDPLGFWGINEVDSKDGKNIAVFLLTNWNMYALSFM